MQAAKGASAGGESTWADKVKAVQQSVYGALYVLSSAPGRFVKSQFNSWLFLAVDFLQLWLLVFDPALPWDIDFSSP